LIKEHELTPSLRHFRSILIAVCKMMGTRFPEFDVWHEQAKRDAQEELANSRKIQKLAYEAGGDLGLGSGIRAGHRFTSQRTSLTHPPSRTIILRWQHGFQTEILLPACGGVLQQMGATMLTLVGEQNSSPGRKPAHTGWLRGGR
jgi:hypothetical protein